MNPITNKMLPAGFVTVLLIIMLNGRISIPRYKLIRNITQPVTLTEAVIHHFQKLIVTDSDNKPVKKDLRG